MKLGDRDFPLAHIAVAVNSIAEAAPVYAAMGFSLSEPEVIAREHVRAQVCVKGELHIELLEPHPAGAGPIAKFIEKRGTGLHHIALKSADLDADIAAVQKTGAKLLDGYPAEGLGGTRVAFLHPKSTGGVLIELVQGGPDEVGVAKRHPTAT
jgi:methylmalonyl-CoA epimerase